MSERRDDDALERDSESLRHHYGRLEKFEPGTDADARILAAARDHNARRLRRLSPVWLAAFGVAASVGLAVVLVPALLVEAPEPHRVPQSSELVIKPADTVRVQTVAQEEAAADVAQPEAPALARERAARAIDEQEERQRQAMRRELQPPPVAATEDTQGFSETNSLQQLHAELAGGGEVEWRTRILALEADGKHRLAGALLADFRTKFGRSEAFSMQDLAREQALNAREKDNN